MDVLNCHACGAAADPHGAFGELCDPCWKRVSAIVARILGRAPAGFAPPLPSRADDRGPTRRGERIPRTYKEK